MTQPPASHRYAQVETERRFLLRARPADLPTDAPSYRLIDRYLTGTRLRLRRLESVEGQLLGLKLGQKYQAPGQPNAQRMMTTIYLDEAEYAALAGIEAAVLIKRRSAYAFGGWQGSVDEFEGELAGLVLLEVEGAQAGPLPLPAEAIREVTGEPFFSGGALAHCSRAALLAALAHSAGLAEEGADS